MSLESGNFIDDLVDTNPVSATDIVREGAGHLRLIKEVLQNTFAGSTGAIIAAGADVGTVNAIVITPVTSLLEYTTRMMIVWLQSITNTGATTINISGLGAKAVVSVANAALVSGDLEAGRVYVGIYDGTSVQLAAVTKNYVDQLAFLAALPAQTGNAGKVVTTDGTTASWSSKLLAGTMRWADSTDQTKQVALNVSNVASATTRTVTVPNKDITLACLDTNTFSGAQYFGTAASLIGAMSTVSAAAVTDIWLGEADTIDYVGTALCSAFSPAPQAGVHRTLIAAGAAQFKCDTALMIDGVTTGQTLILEAGDRAHVISLSTANARMHIDKSNGNQVGGAYSILAVGAIAASAISLSIPLQTGYELILKINGIYAQSAEPILVTKNSETAGPIDTIPVRALNQGSTANANCAFIDGFYSASFERNRTALNFCELALASSQVGGADVTITLGNNSATGSQRLRGDIVLAPLAGTSVRTLEKGECFAVFKSTGQMTAITLRPAGGAFMGGIWTLEGRKRG